MRHRSVTSLALFASVAALSFVAGASPAMASVTIGQLAPSSPPANCAFGPLDIIVPTVTSGNSYVVPGGGGRITSWSTNAAAGAGQMLTMKVVRKVADPMTYRAVGHDGPRPLDPGVLNTFAVDIAVQPGDVLGVDDENASSVHNACYFDDPADFYLFSSSLADGEEGAFSQGGQQKHPNVTAVVEPPLSNPPNKPLNAFHFNELKRNRNKGTATLAFNLPNPGDLSGSGQGAQVASTGAVTSKAVPAGIATLMVKAKGKKKRKLNEKGEVKLNLAITYTPTGGDPSTQSVKVKLQKKL